MATDRDDDISRRYRALAREEPPAGIDAAILATSRRAAGSRPGGVKRWGPPLSIAAMLVLATGVVLRMQSEKPGVENAIPRAQVPPGAPTAPVDAPVEPKALQELPKPQAKKSDTVAPERKEAQRRTGPKPLAPSAEEPAPQPSSPPLQNLHAVPMAIPARPAAAPASAGAAIDSAARHDSLDLQKRAKATAPRSPEAALESIARLRAEGRDEDADRALEAFRRDFPDYRIPEAQWARVKPPER